MTDFFDEAEYGTYLRVGFDLLQKLHAEMDEEEFAYSERTIYESIGRINGVDPRKVREDMEDFDWMLDEED